MLAEAVGGCSAGRLLPTHEKKKESKEEKCESCKKADEILLEIFTFKVVPHRLVSSLDVLL